jgi:leucyl/phenylalanyl-tRNA---protein transferase
VRRPARRYTGWDSFEYTGSSVDPNEPVAFCGDLSPAGVLAAYRRGLFPLAAPGLKRRVGKRVEYAERVASGAVAIVGSADGSDVPVDPYWAEWWSSDPRPIIDVSAVHVARGTRKTILDNDLRTTANTSFKRVVEECRAGRPSEWLTDELVASLVALHEDGWAHSTEVWLDGDLVGGTIGIGIGKVISGDTVFNRMANAGRIAIIDMVARFRDAGGQLMDCQVFGPLSPSLGVASMPRADYLKVLESSTERVELDGTELPAKRLLPVTEKANMGQPKPPKAQASKAPKAPTPA